MLIETQCFVYIALWGVLLCSKMFTHWQVLFFISNEEVFKVNVSFYQSYMTELSFIHFGLSLNYSSYYHYY